MDEIDIEELIDGLKGRVVRRRASGDYPAGLEEQLEAEFAVIMAAVRRDECDTTELGRRVDRVERSSHAVQASGAVSSRVPGGVLVHAAAARIIGRHTGQLADAVRTLGVDTASALHEVRHLVDVQREADERQLHDVVSSLLDRVAIVDHLANVVILLEERVEALENGLSRPS